ncbi:MAG: hypothetical protein HC828_13820 [Blastochloris sp.]|nr:hypothetical protein [Blastochloris sp.]
MFSLPSFIFATEHIEIISRHNRVPNCRALYREDRRLRQRERIGNCLLHGIEQHI